jgi:KRAB domain-containing zinc finger protein
MYDKVLAEDVEHVNHIEKRSSLAHLSAEPLTHDEQFISVTQGRQSTTRQQAKVDATRLVLKSNPYSTDPSISISSIPDDSYRNRVNSVESAEEHQLHCQPGIHSGIEAVVEMLLENSRHLPGFTQIIEQAADNRECDLGIKEAVNSTMGDAENDKLTSIRMDSTTQGSDLVIPERQLGSSSANEKSTSCCGDAPASNVESDTCNETYEKLCASNAKRGKQDLIKRHKCPECDKLFPRASSLKRHIVLHLDDRPYQCTACEANYKSYSQLKRHLRIHTGEKPAKCEHCEKAFRTYNELYVHRRSHTGEKPFECKFCGKCFSTRGYRNTHERIHTGEKRFQCDICGMKFTESSARRVHGFTHTGETPYKCDVCGRGFTQAGNLSKHVKTLHSKVKPFKCQECDKEFAVKEELNRHFSRVHSSDKPYQCKHCGKKYAINSDLTQHMRTHRNRCSNCGTKFKTGEELQRHMENCLISATKLSADSTERIV